MNKKVISKTSHNIKAKYFFESGFFCDRKLTAENTRKYVYRILRQLSAIFFVIGLAEVNMIV
jgi:hypothetical protein